MANRENDFSPTVTNVVPENSQTPMLTAIADFGERVAEQSAHTKALQATSDTQIAYRQLDNQYRLTQASDPDNPEALQKLQQARQEVAQQLSQNVPAITQRDYNNKVIELSQASDASNEVWATQQHVRNIKSNMLTSRTNYLTEANSSGRDFAQGNDVDLSSALSYLQAHQSIKQFADPVLGSDKTDAFLKSFNADYVKSFVAGVAELNPVRAAQLLNDPEISQHFTTQDRGDMADLIKRTQKQSELVQQLQTVKSTGDLTRVVNDPNASYFEKRAEIDRLDMQGSITPKAAAAARRVIKSSSDLDNQTDTPVMADIIKQVYDLNENTSLKSSDYLKGIGSLQDLVLEKQDAGQISPSDTVKLTKEIQTLTQKRQADATQSVGYQFGAANKKFDSLPPEYRGQATRQLFYATQGQELTLQQTSDKADMIMDQINKERRTEALSIISRTSNDDTFLQATGYKREDVAATAQKYGISQQQVIQELRNKYGTNPRRSKRVQGVAPADDRVDTSNGINIPAPPPDDSEEE